MRLKSVIRIETILAVTILFVASLSMAEIKYLRLGYDSVNLDTFDVTKIDTMAKAFFLKKFAQTLVDTDMDGKVIPSIAKSWHISPDMKTYTFSLFEGIHFHDGRQLTSSDVAYSIKLIKNSTVNPMNIYLQRIEEIDILDEYSLSVRLKLKLPEISDTENV